MKNYYLFLLFLLSAKPMLAQISSISEFPLPTLKKKLAESKSDTDRIRLQIAVGRAILLKPAAGNKEIDSAQSFADQASKISHQINYSDGIVNSMLLSALSL